MLSTKVNCGHCRPNRRNRNPAYRYGRHVPLAPMVKLQVMRRWEGVGGKLTWSIAQNDVRFNLEDLLQGLEACCKRGEYSGEPRLANFSGSWNDDNFNVFYSRNLVGECSMMSGRVSPSYLQRLHSPQLLACASRKWYLFPPPPL